MEAKTYTTPLIEVMQLSVESGFANSITGEGEDPIQGNIY